MAKESLLIADDIAERSTKARLRSRVIRENAIELAKKMNLDVDYLFVSNLNSQFLKKSKISLLSETVSRMKITIEDQFAKAQVPLKMMIKYGVPAEQIISEIYLIEKPKILVLGTQGKKGLKKFLLGSVAEEVLRNSPLPTLVVGPVAQEKRAVIKLDQNLQVYVLTDLSESSLEAEKFAMKLCSQFKCSALLVHSVGEQIMKIRENLYSTGYIPFNIEKMFNQMVEDAQRDLNRKARAWTRQGINATAHLIEKEEILEKSLKGLRPSPTSVIIMGTHGRNKVMSSFLGSTARQFLLTSPVPVVVVRSIK